MDSPSGSVRAGMPADEALPRLVRSHGSRIYALGLRLCSSHEDAEDLVQETFLRAWQHWDGFEGRAQPSTWLYSIAVQTCQKLHRRRAGQPAVMESFEELLPRAHEADSLLPVVEESPLDAAILAERVAALEDQIPLLPPQFRLPLLLKDILGLPLQQVGDILGIKEATVKTRLHRARLRLRRELDPKLGHRPAPPLPQDFSRSLCLDLLRAKLEALDNDAPFPLEEQIGCERCRAVFATLDHARDLCRELGREELPEELRLRLAEPVA